VQVFALNGCFDISEPTLTLQLAKRRVQRSKRECFDYIIVQTCSVKLHSIRQPKGRQRETATHCTTLHHTDDGDCFCNFKQRIDPQSRVLNYFL